MPCCRRLRALGKGLFVAIGFASCTWLPAGARAGAAPPASAASLVAGGATIDACAAVALERSRVLRDAELGLDVAAKQVREAWGNLFPTIEASATLTRNLTASETFFPARIFDPSAGEGDLIPVRFVADNLWNTTVTLDQPLFKAQALVGVGAAARFRALQTEVVRGAAQQTVTEVRTLFYSVLLESENVRLTEESVRRVRRTLEETRALHRAGLASSYDVLRLEVELGNLEPNLQRARNALAREARALRVAMGLDVAAALEPAGSLRDLDFGAPGSDAGNAALVRTAGVRVEGPGDLERLSARARSERSDLRQARLGIELARAELAAERATLYPTVSAFASYQLHAQENGSLDFFGENADQRTSNWMAGLRLELPIFRGGQDWSRVAQRRLGVLRRDTFRDLQVQRAEDEVRTRLDELVEARARATAQERAVAQARRGFEIAAAEYRQGTGSQLRVTDAEVALRESEFNYARAVHDVLRAQGALDLAVGVVPLVDSVEAGP